MAIVRARTSFWIENRMVSVGTLLRDTDPLVASKPDLFESAEDVVEQATAAPGEKRSVKRAPAAKKAAAPADTPEA